MIQISAVGNMIPEVWIEDRYLRVRGNVLIRRAFIVNSNGKSPLSIDFNSNELRFNHADAVGVEYDGGVYTKLTDGWVVGEYSGEVYRIYGFSKMYLSNRFEPLGFELEVVPLEFTSNLLKVEVTLNDRPIMCELKVRNGRKLTVIFMDDYCEKIELRRGLNVITAKYVEKFGEYNKCILSTLTIKI